MKSLTRFLRPIALGALIGVAVLVVVGRGEPRAEDSKSACDAEQRSGFETRVDALKQTYAELSDIYQRSQSTSDADIPLK